MDNELKEVLRSVLKEELQPINKRLDGVDKRLDGFEQRFERVENGIKELISGQEQLQKNLIQSLGSYTEKIIENVDDKTGALNKRVFAVETEVQRLARQ